MTLQNCQVGRVELSLYDWRMRQAADPRSVHPDIVLVEINDTSIRDLSQVAGRWPWPRVLRSSLLEVSAKYVRGAWPFIDAITGRFERSKDSPGSRSE